MTGTVAADSKLAVTVSAETGIQSSGNMPTRTRNGVRMVFMGIGCWSRAGRADRSGGPTEVMRIEHVAIRRSMDEAAAGIRGKDAGRFGSAVMELRSTIGPQAWSWRTTTGSGKGKRKKHRSLSIRTPNTLQFHGGGSTRWAWPASRKD